MDIDFSSLFGAGFLLAIVIPVLVGLVSLVLFYLVVRGAVRSGMRDHHNWVEKQLTAARAGHEPPRHTSVSIE